MQQPLVICKPKEISGHSDKKQIPACKCCSVIGNISSFFSTVSS